MAEIEQNEGPKKGSKLKLIIIIVVGVILATALSVVGTLYLLGGSGEGTADDQAQKPQEPEHVPARYFELEEPLIVSLGNEERYAQVHLALVMRDHDIGEELEKHLPTLRNRLQRVLQRQDFRTLQRLEKKEKLAETMLETVNATLEEEGVNAVERVLFTNFVMQ